MDEEQTLPDFLRLVLDPPVEVSGVGLPEITVKPPTLGQVRDAQMKLDDSLNPSPGSEREYQLTLIALNSGKGRALVDALPIGAVRQAMNYLNDAMLVELPDRPQGDDDRLVIELDAPLRSSNGGQVQQVELRAPTGGEIRAAEGLMNKERHIGTVRRYQARLIELVSGLPPFVIAQLPFSKAREAMRFLEHFEDSARPTSKR